MSPPGRVGVVGLGLVGGSLARDLRARGVEVLGWDADPATLAAAAAEGVVPMGRDLRELAGADLVVLAIPVTAARDALPAIAGASSGAVMTDVGSTKRSIMAAASAAGVDDRFVGAHPLAGGESSGWTASRAGLFRGARVFITPAPTASAAAVRRVTELWRGLGGAPELTTAREHDALMAWVSHAPQALSSALGVALQAAGVSRAEMGPGGRDATRLAGSSPEVWAQILAENSDEVAPAIRSVIARLQSIALAVETADIAELQAVLRRAREWSAGS